MINIDGFDLDITDEELRRTQARRELGLPIMETLPAAPRFVREHFISGIGFAFQAELFTPVGGVLPPIFTVLEGITDRKYVDMSRFINGDSDVTVANLPDSPGVDFPAFIPEVSKELDACTLVGDKLKAFPQVHGMYVINLPEHEWALWLADFNQDLLSALFSNNRAYLKENVDAWVARGVQPPSTELVHPWVRAQVTQVLGRGTH